MAEAITFETVMAGKLRDGGHLNYGKRGGGTLWRHTTIPRLYAIDRPTLNDAETQRVGARRLREWSVDGGKATSLEIAIEALNVPAVISLGEFLVLSKVPDEFEWLRAVQARIAGISEDEAPVCLNDHPRYHAVSTALFRLKDAGFIELEARPLDHGPFGPRTMPTVRKVRAHV